MPDISHMAFAGRGGIRTFWPTCLTRLLMSSEVFGDIPQNGLRIVNRDKSVLPSHSRMNRGRKPVITKPEKVPLFP